MTTEHIISTMGRHLSMALGAEQAIAEDRLNRFTRRLVLLGFAGLASVCGIIALNMASFLGLATYLSSAFAMLAVGLVDLLIAAIITLIAAARARDRNIVAAEEIRNHAYEALDLDIKLATRDLAGFARHPLAPLIWPGLSLLASWLMKNCQGRDGAAR